jgi:thiamine pyrophosphokinase
VTAAPPVLRLDHPVTLIGGGLLDEGVLREALALAPDAAAADGGADAALRHAVPLRAVIGDMDSLSPEARHAFRDRLHRVEEQDSTDFDKALTRIDAPAILAVGFTGGRLDHELAALHSLVLRRSRPCLLLGPQTLALHLPPALALDLAPGTLVSLFPLAPVGTRSTGLRWATDHLRFDPSTRIGTSNEATGPVTLAPSGPGMLLILPRATVPLALSACLAAPRWPASPGG